MVNNNRTNARNTPSKSFSQILYSVPTLAQGRIVEQAIIPFLDTISRKDANRAISAARKAAKKAHRIPPVDMAAKKKEIHSLIDELQKELKFSSRSSGNKCEALMLEVIESAAHWLNDLWSVSVEFGLDFPRVHSCLHTSVNLLDHVRGMKGGGCQCLSSTIYVPVTIRDRAGKVIKEFNDSGITNVESAVFWVWRDVFLALLASKKPTYIELVPDLLEDIDDEMGWIGLERLVLGGDTYSRDSREENSTDTTFSRPRRPEELDRAARSFSEPQDKDDMFYAEYWNYRLVKQVPRFRQLVQQRMIEVFKASPSVLLYNLIVALSADVPSVTTELHEILSWLAPVSTNSLATALGIYCSESKFNEVASLLDTHSFLLRPREGHAIQESVRILATSHKPGHRELALRVAERELLDVLEMIRHAVLGSFGRLDTEESRFETRQIFKLSTHSTERQERVQRLVESVSTPGTGAMNPMALAAMMMGLPIPIPMPMPPQEAGEGGFGDAAEAAIAAATAAVAAGAGNGGEGNLDFMDLDPHDPIFTEMQEEYRPDLKGRFEAWVETIKFFGYLRAATVLGEGEDENTGEGKKSLHDYAKDIVDRESVMGESVLMRVYKSMYNSMPWVLAPDLVEEMIGKLIGKPSKVHICSGLQSLSSFVNGQKRKQWLALARQSRSSSMLQMEQVDGEATGLTDDVSANSPGDDEVWADAGAGSDENWGVVPPQEEEHQAHDVIENIIGDSESESDFDEGNGGNQTAIGNTAGVLEAMDDAFAQLTIHTNPNPTLGGIVIGQDIGNAEHWVPPNPGNTATAIPGPAPFFTQPSYVGMDDLD